MAKFSERLTSIAVDSDVAVSSVQTLNNTDEFTFNHDLNISPISEIYFRVFDVTAGEFLTSTQRDSNFTFVESSPSSTLITKTTATLGPDYKFYAYYANKGLEVNGEIVGVSTVTDSNDVLAQQFVGSSGSALYFAGALKFQTLTDGAQVDGSLKLNSGGQLLTLSHSASAPRTVTLPDLSGEVVLDAGTQTIGGAKTFSDSVSLSNGGTVTNGLTFTDTSSAILTDTADAADNKRIQIGGGGGASATRGAYINLYGNEYTSTGGYLDLIVGSATGSLCRIFQGGVTPFVSETDSAVANTLYLKAGNVGFGTVDPDVTAHVEGRFFASGTHGTSAGGQVARFGYAGGGEGDEIFEIYTYGPTYVGGSLMSVGADGALIGTRQAGNLGILSGGDIRFGTDNSGVVKGELSTSGRWTFGASSSPQAHDFYDSVRFPNGGNQELDYYGAGTWTPALINGGTNSVTGARYVRVGKMCTATFYIVSISPTANTNEFRVSLPFTASTASTTYYWVGNIGFSSSADASGIRPLVREGTNYVYFHYVDGSTGSTITNNGWIASGIVSLIVQITYETA